MWARPSGGRACAAETTCNPSGIEPSTMTVTAVPDETALRMTRSLALQIASRCQRRLKIRPKGGAKDCHLGWWSDLGVRLGVGDAVRGFFGGSGQRSHAELKRSAPAGRPQGGMVYRILLIHESPLTDALFLLVSKSDEVTTT